MGVSLPFFLTNNIQFKRKNILPGNPPPTKPRSSPCGGVGKAKRQTIGLNKKTKPLLTNIVLSFITEITKGHKSFTTNNMTNQE